ncbi:chaperonin GroEL, partial [uncultured Prochlorococcus sp.]|uniref:chaperonin GroEL n=1 Tax=uncultured Prochlorococcus sp. TaxID=159733 RepID=UPI0032B14F3B
MPKQLSFSNESREALEKGINTVANAVKVTIGPKAKNVVIERKFGSPDIVRDGSTVAKEINLENPISNLGAKLIEQVASKTKESAGDGTTTATILTQIMVQEGLKNIAAGASPIELKKGMEKGLDFVLEKLKSKSIKINGSDIKKVATVSAGGDEEIGSIISKAMDIVTSDGVITVEESQSLETELDITEGMSFDRGYSSPYFVTDQERQICELENPKILITDQKISTLTNLVPILEEVQKSASPFLILAEDIEGEALTTLVLNKNSGVLNVSAVRAPSFGERRKAALEDIAILTGAKLISEDQSMKLEEVTLNDLGKAKKITISKDKTTIVAFDDTKDLVQARVEKLKREVEITESEYDKDKINERIAKLAGGVALIKVGAATETEMKYKKLRIEDSLNATKAAIEEGVVSGGGQTLIEISNELSNLRKEISDDLTTGIDIITNALLEPTKQIAKNAGFNGDVVIADIKRLGKGFNANNGEYENLNESGILDPTKVIRLALQDSVSIAAMIITTEVAVADIPEPEAAPGGPGADPMGGMGG